MTVKLNLNPLIKHFGEDSNVGRCLSRHAGLTPKNNKKVNKLADILVEIANEVDASDPELAKEADNILKDLVKEAGYFDSISLPVVEEESEETPIDEPTEVGGAFLMEKEGDPEMEEVIEIEEPMIEEIPEPEPEYDEVSLEDLEERRDNYRFRISDKGRREKLEEAISVTKKAIEYNDATNRFRNKAHDIFDDMGESFRLKKFD